MHVTIHYLCLLYFPASEFLYVYKMYMQDSVHVTLALWTTYIHVSVWGKHIIQNCILLILACELLHYIIIFLAMNSIIHTPINFYKMGVAGVRCMTLTCDNTTDLGPRIYIYTVVSRVSAHPPPVFGLVSVSAHVPGKRPPPFFSIQAKRPPR